MEILASDNYKYHRNATHDIPKPGRTQEQSLFGMSPPHSKEYRVPRPITTCWRLMPITTTKLRKKITPRPLPPALPLPQPSPSLSPQSNPLGLTNAGVNHSLGVQLYYLRTKGSRLLSLSSLNPGFHGTKENQHSRAVWGIRMTQQRCSNPG